MLSMPLPQQAPIPSIPKPASYSRAPSPGVKEYETMIGWSGDKEKTVLAPYEYLTSTPGKNVRSQLIHALNVWLRVPSDALSTIEHIVDMLHNASLLIDDIEDNSPMRRGSPSAHVVYGIPQTINSANYVYFLALREAMTLKNPGSVEIYAEELIHLHRGQGMDLFWRETITCPTESEYVDMVSRKTGGLFRLIVRLMTNEAGLTLNLKPLADLLGVVFQVRDDYLNLSPQYAVMKGYCEDLDEGKFSFPVIHSIKANPEDQFLLDVLKEKGGHEEQKRKAVEYMRDVTDTFAYAKRFLEMLDSRLHSEVERLDRESGIENKVLLQLVSKLMEFLRE